jgi:hypothetical protein
MRPANLISSSVLLTALNVSTFTSAVEMTEVIPEPTTTTYPEPTVFATLNEIGSHGVHIITIPYDGLAHTIPLTGDITDMLGFPASLAGNPAATFQFPAGGFDGADIHVSMLQVDGNSESPDPPILPIVTCSHSPKGQYLCPTELPSMTVSIQAKNLIHTLPSTSSKSQAARTAIPGGGLFNDVKGAIAKHVDIPSRFRQWVEKHKKELTILAAVFGGIWVTLIFLGICLCCTIRCCDGCFSVDSFLNYFADRLDSLSYSTIRPARSRLRRNFRRRSEFCRF